MKSVQLLALMLAGSCAQAPAQNSQMDEQQALMDRIEHVVRLPQGAGPLASYSRYYAWQQVGTARQVVATYQNLTGERPGRRWVTEREFPVIMDGGCGVISLSYDPASQQVTSVQCNGYA